VKTDRWFYSATGATFIVMMLVGFRWFITSGRAAGGSLVDPVMVRLDLVHGLAIATWYVLFIRCILTRSFDRYLALGYAFWVVIFIASEKLALLDAWSAGAAAILKL
jgi:hypothetical protein